MNGDTLPFRRQVQNTALARALRIQLVILLGGACAVCGDPTGDLLEIDHVEGCTWSRRGVNSLQRVLRYWREYLAGVPLRCLCRSCNAKDGGARRWA